MEFYGKIMTITFIPIGQHIGQTQFGTTEFDYNLTDQLTSSNWAKTIVDCCRM